MARNKLLSFYEEMQDNLIYRVFRSFNMEMQDHVVLKFLSEQLEKKDLNLAGIEPEPPAGNYGRSPLNPLSCSF